MRKAVELDSDELRIAVRMYLRQKGEIKDNETIILTFGKYHDGSTMASAAVCAISQPIEEK